MNTLFTFGCSYTADFETGNLIPYLKYKEYRGGTYPKSWPTLLSEKIGMEIKNYGIGGVGNQSIFEQFCIHSDEIKENDIVIIGWSYVHRYRWASDNWIHVGAGPITNINLGQDNETHEKIILNRTNKLYVDEVFNYIKLIDTFSKSKKFKVFYWFADEIITKNLNENTLNKNSIILWKNDLFRTIYNEGGKNIKQETNGKIDDLHFGELGHKIMSNIIYGHIQHKII
jgi:hypothetical protein